MSLLRQLRGELPASSPVIREGSTGSVPQEPLRGRPELVRRAMAALPNSSAHFPTRDHFISVAYALRAAFGPDLVEEARETFHDWAGRWQDGANDPAYTDAEFDRCKPPYRRGAPWLYKLAHELSDGAFNVAEQWFEPVAEVESLFPPERGDTAPIRSLRFVSFAEATAGALSAGLKPLIKGLLDQGTMSVVYGDSNAGKTFVVIALAYHVATGTPWLGRTVAATGVGYVAAEGGRNITRRFLALQKVFGDVPRLHLLAHPIDLYDPNADLQTLIAEITEMARAGEPLGLIFIDTLARAMGNGDENTARDMGQFVRHMDAIRTATGAHVAVVHHTGKDASKGARGSSVLRAATDTEIEIVKGGTLTATKQRDLDGDLSVTFRLESVELGRDADGDPITSCVARFFVPAKEASPAEGLDGLSADVYEAVEALTSNANPTGVTAPEVAAWLAANESPANADSVRTTLRRLTTKGILVKSGVGRWSLRRPSSRVLTADYFDPNADKMSSDGTAGGLFN